MKDSSGPGSQLEGLSPERDKLSLVNVEAARIAECIQEKLAESLAFCGDMNVDVTVEVDEDWPYTVYVDVKAQTRHCSSGKIQDIVEKAVEECLSSAEKRLSRLGLKPLP